MSAFMKKLRAIEDQVARDTEGDIDDRWVPWVWVKAGLLQVHPRTDYDLPLRIAEHFEIVEVAGDLESDFGPLVRLTDSRLARRAA